LRYAVSFIRAHWDVRIVVYMDDLLLLHQDRTKLETYTLQIAAYLQWLGWTLSLKKCSFSPARVITYLGWIWDTSALTLAMTPEMRSSILDSLRVFLNLAMTGGSTSSRALGGLIGSLSFLRAQFPRASLYLRTSHSVLTAMVASVGWTGSSTLSPKIASELLFWSRNVRRNVPYCFEQRRSEALLTSDACGDGWGVHLDIGAVRWHSHGLFSLYPALTSSNQRETAAVLKALHEFEPVLRSRKIHAMTVQCDNTVTVYNLQRQGCGVPLLKLTRAIFSKLLSLDIRIAVRHIPGIENVFADALSRMDASGDYSLRSDVVQMGIRTLQTIPTMDLFANCENTKCKSFAALRGPLQQGSIGKSAFELD
jgi:hypothetical protein